MSRITEGHNCVCGEALQEEECSLLVCPACKNEYYLEDGLLKELTEKDSIECIP
jgi:uncharacterized protein YbaR (Trm112 family)